MSIYDKITAEPAPPRKLRRFAYQVYDGGIEHHIASHEIYFYEAGRVGFWNIDDDGERTLVLATKAFQIRQVIDT
ncbi:MULTISPECIES: hypothetical protein [Arthrobacter]|uniref:Uncharacterized protein n=1 Tax=Arthrobacter terricola TaxID=2547396 RepID=A0A4V6PIB0_9MICC|nr:MULTISPECIES: hypothetical protein [Arthrobacter]MBT8163056.1 hypothetical protein [Arthrobacter sp. GN70]TDF88096.1 hypothetical protein E1809_24055 [Arthrobacter terricola]